MIRTGKGNSGKNQYMVTLVSCEYAHWTLMAQVRPAPGNGGSTSWEIHRCYPKLQLSGYLIWTISSIKLGSWSSWQKTLFHRIGSSIDGNFDWSNPISLLTPKTAPPCPSKDLRGPAPTPETSGSPGQDLGSGSKELKTALPCPSKDLRGPAPGTPGSYRVNPDLPRPPKRQGPASGSPGRDPVLDTLISTYQGKEGFSLKLFSPFFLSKMQLQSYISQVL